MQYRRDKMHLSKFEWTIKTTKIKAYPFDLNKQKSSFLLKIKTLLGSTFYPGHIYKSGKIIFQNLTCAKNPSIKKFTTLIFQS